MAVRLLPALLLLALPAPGGDYANTRVGVLEEFPREVRRGTELVIRGITKGAFRSPELIIIAPDGRTFLNKDNVVTDVSFSFTVVFEHGRGRYRMEIIAHKPTSTRSVARFSVWYAMRKPTTDPEPPPPEGAPAPMEIHPRLLEKRWLGRLNAFRRSIRLKPVAWNEAVSARCREHALRQAQARRHIHKFPPHGGVDDLLKRSGAGKQGWSGPDGGWLRVTTRRPFPRPAPQPPGRGVLNHVVPFVMADDPKLVKVPISVEKLFEATFVREAAWRICAADPNCIEAGVGIQRPSPPAKTGKKKGTWHLRYDSLYYSVCFVQVNDETLIEAQDKAYAALLKQAAGRDPTVLRRVGIWGRRRGLALVRGALKDKRHEVAGAAFDAYLLLDESRARAHLARAVGGAARLLERGRYAGAVKAWRPFLLVAYDRRVRQAALDARAQAEKKAAAELKAAQELADPERSQKLANLLGRVGGLAVEARVRSVLNR